MGPSLPGFPKLNLRTTSILLASTFNTSLLHLNPATVIASSTSLLKSGKLILISSMICPDHPSVGGKLTSTTSKSCNLENSRSINQSLFSNGWGSVITFFFEKGFIDGF